MDTTLALAYIQEYWIRGSGQLVKRWSGSGRKCPGEPGDAAGFPWGEGGAQEEPRESEEEEMSW